jgi:hypothetical protein
MFVGFRQARLIKGDVNFGFASGWLKVSQIKQTHLAETEMLPFDGTEVPFRLDRRLIYLSETFHWSRCLYVSSKTLGTCNAEKALLWWLNYHDPNIWFAVFSLGLIVKLISIGPGDVRGSSHF